MRRRIVSVLVFFAAGAGLALTPALASAAHKGPHVCKGTATKPGVLKGKHKFGAVVKGFCVVNAGPATVLGDLTLKKGAVLVAEFGQHNSKLTVVGDLVMDSGSTLLLGCGTPESICIDDPNQQHPTIKSLPTVTGSLIEDAPLGAIVHLARIGSDIVETGGGGGLGCTPEGVFASLIHAPVFSDYEDSSVGGNVTITKLRSCYLGVARLHVKGSIRISRDKLADPDAIEILANHVKHDLICRRDSAVWDNAELPTDPMGAIFPRTAPQRNQVGGHRRGMCRVASPMTQGGTGSGAF